MLKHFHLFLLTFYNVAAEFCVMTYAAHTVFLQTALV